MLNATTSEKFILVYVMYYIDLHRFRYPTRRRSFPTVSPNVGVSRAKLGRGKRVSAAAPFAVAAVVRVTRTRS